MSEVRTATDRTRLAPGTRVRLRVPTMSGRRGPGVVIYPEESSGVLTVLLDCSRYERGRFTLCCRHEVSVMRKPTADRPDPMPWRAAVAAWPDDRRERWGRLANELAEAGTPWPEDERLAFDRVSAEGDAAAPASAGAAVETQAGLFGPDAPTQRTRPPGRLKHPGGRRGHQRATHGP